MKNSLKRCPTPRATHQLQNRMAFQNTKWDAFTEHCIRVQVVAPVLIRGSCTIYLDSTGLPLLLAVGSMRSFLYDNI